MEFTKVSGGIVLPLPVDLLEVDAGRVTPSLKESNCAYIRDWGIPLPDRNAY